MKLEGCCRSEPFTKFQLVPVERYVKNIAVDSSDCGGDRRILASGFKSRPTTRIQRSWNASCKDQVLMECCRRMGNLTTHHSLRPVGRFLSGRSRMRQSQDLCGQFCATSVCSRAKRMIKPGAQDLRLAAGHFHIETRVVKCTGPSAVKVVSGEVRSAAVRRQEKLITVQAPISDGGAAARHRTGRFHLPLPTKPRTLRKHPR